MRREIPGGAATGMLASDRCNQVSVRMPTSRSVYAAHSLRGEAPAQRFRRLFAWIAWLAA